MIKPYKRTRRSDPLGESIIRYEGNIIKSIKYNEIANIGKVLCTCGRIVQVNHWLLHTQRPICLNYHELTKKTPMYERIIL